MSNNGNSSRPRLGITQRNQTVFALKNSINRWWLVLFLKCITAYWYDFLGLHHDNQASFSAWCLFVLFTFVSSFLSLFNGSHAVLFFPCLSFCCFLGFASRPCESNLFQPVTTVRRHGAFLAFQQEFALTALPFDPNCKFGVRLVVTRYVRVTEDTLVLFQFVQPFLPDLVVAVPYEAKFFQGRDPVVTHTRVFALLFEFVL
mmetsp:Transcript_47076/g.114904  ORF Transcript_47076/g.114904 Transcript_47076/m.114904 type:complete len:202 (-) Transcript_47076:1327-1932(-)